MAHSGRIVMTEAQLRAVAAGREGPRRIEIERDRRRIPVGSRGLVTEEERMSAQTMARDDLHEEATWAWWLLMIVGLLSIAAGVIVLTKPSESLATLAVVIGIFVLANGIF